MHAGVAEASSAIRGSLGMRHAYTGGRLRDSNETLGRGVPPGIDARDYLKERNPKSWGLWVLPPQSLAQLEL